MKKKLVVPSLFLIAGIVVAIATVAGATKLLGSHSDISTACGQAGHAYRVSIENAAVVPAAVTARRCDTLTITNRDAVTREIGFGQHDHHVAYDGVSEKVLRQDESLTITLNAVGQYHYHDHFHDEVAGSFSVSQ